MSEIDREELEKCTDEAQIGDVSFKEMSLGELLKCADHGPEAFDAWLRANYPGALNADLVVDVELLRQRLIEVVDDDPVEIGSVRWLAKWSAILAILPGGVSLLGMKLFRFGFKKWHEVRSGKE